MKNDRIINLSDGNSSMAESQRQPNMQLLLRGTNKEKVDSSLEK
jgi:hypothetical protein